MRRRGRVDSNQKEIVAALRQIGAFVQSLADIGKGCPDLLVGCAGRTFLLEVKDGSKPKSARALTPDEELWIERWRGAPVFIVESAEQAIRSVTFVEGRDAA
jgi:hypothetical protein